MADQQTLRVYDDAAPVFAKEWSEQPVPDDLYRLLSEFFEPGLTADIGCGSGRDLAWLASRGFSVRGFDFSEGLLVEARKRYPALSFSHAELPQLDGITTMTFQNVLCETVLMHLEPGLIAASVRRLLDILVPGGVLHLSWRVTEGKSQRDKAGRLYAAFRKEAVLAGLSPADAVLYDREAISESSGKKIHRLVVKKGAGLLSGRDEGARFLSGGDGSLAMSKKALEERLQKTGLVSASLVAEIVERFQHKLIARNELQLQVGKMADEYLYLEKGYMRSFAYSTEGDEVTTNFYLPGQMVFEVSSFFNRTRSKEGIQALTDCEGWFLSYEALNDLFHRFPEFREFGRSMLVKGFADLKIRMLSMITETAEGRYEQLLQEQPEIFQHASLKNIASYLGITDTSLSRIRKELSKR
jgi:CRP-like cAMP-binding protein/ubiquinone/menaquinone biosynthesis C-methylase UbiE